MLICLNTSEAQTFIQLGVDQYATAIDSTLANGLLKQEVQNGWLADVAISTTAMNINTYAGKVCI